MPPFCKSRGRNDSHASTHESCGTLNWKTTLSPPMGCRTKSFIPGLAENSTEPQVLLHVQRLRPCRRVDSQLRQLAIHFILSDVPARRAGGQRSAQVLAAVRVQVT